jgi:hypothetical protein
MVTAAIRALECLVKVLDWGRSRSWCIFTDSDSTALVISRSQVPWKGRYLGNSHVNLRFRQFEFPSCLLWFDCRIISTLVGVGIYWHCPHATIARWSFKRYHHHYRRRRLASTIHFIMHLRLPSGIWCSHRSAPGDWTFPGIWCRSVGRVVPGASTDRGASIFRAK